MHWSPTNSGQAHDVVLLDEDRVLRADRRARVAGDLLGAVEHREGAARARRQILGDRGARARLEDLGRAVPLGRDLADVAAERARDLQPADLAR